nr:hypothetical protein [uncultured Dorea sp.]
MAVSFVYGRLENVGKPDAGIGERDERIYCRKFDKYRSAERDCDFNE